MAKEKIPDPPTPPGVETTQDEKAGPSPHVLVQTPQGLETYETGTEPQPAKPEETKPKDPKDPGPEYKVVGQPAFVNGYLHPVGTVLRTNLEKKEHLGSPSESLMPLDHKGPWPPVAYRKARDQRALDANRR